MLDYCSQSFSNTLVHKNKFCALIPFLCTDPLEEDQSSPLISLHIDGQDSQAAMAFAQVVVGPPGAGKTTYCKGMQEFLSKIGRKVAIVNLDPANDLLPYDAAIDISDLVNLDDVMENLKLGPNGGLIYCMEYLEKNFDWLKDQLEKLKDCYLLFDCPGQVELYTHHDSVKTILAELQKLNYKLAAIHLVDSHYCSDPSKFISVLLTSLSTMLQLELPHVNVLSKVDLVESYGKLAFNLDYYTEVLDLSYLVDHLADDPFLKKFKKLNEAITGVVQHYSLVSFSTLNIKDKESLFNLMKVVDKANGYVFGDLEERSVNKLMSVAVGADFEYFRSAAVQEKYMEDGDERERMETEEELDALLKKQLPNI